MKLSVGFECDINPEVGISHRPQMAEETSNFPNRKNKIRGKNMCALPRELAGTFHLEDTLNDENLTPRGPLGNQHKTESRPSLYRWLFSVRESGDIS